MKISGPNFYFGALLLSAFALSACGFTPQGDLIRDTVAQRGAQAFDEGLGNAEWFMCEAASVGSVKRRYGTSQKRADAWKEICEGDGSVTILDAQE